MGVSVGAPSSQANQCLLPARLLSAISLMPPAVVHNGLVCLREGEGEKRVLYFQSLEYVFMATFFSVARRQVVASICGVFSFLVFWPSFLFPGSSSFTCSRSMVGPVSVIMFQGPLLLSVCLPYWASGWVFVWRLRLIV